LTFGNSNLFLCVNKVLKPWLETISNFSKLFYKDEDKVLRKALKSQFSSQNLYSTITTMINKPNTYCFRIDCNRLV